MISISSPFSLCFTLYSISLSKLSNSSVPPLACGYMDLSIDSRLPAWGFQTGFLTPPLVMTVGQSLG